MHIFKMKFLRKVVKKGCLCNINVWRRKSGNSMEGFYSHLSCISRIFRPECSFGRRKTTNPCIQVPGFPPRLPGARRCRNEFCRFVKKYDNTQNTDTILCSMSPPYCVARICIRVFVLPFYRKNQPPRELIFYLYFYSLSLFIFVIDANFRSHKILHIFRQVCGECFSGECIERRRKVIGETDFSGMKELPFDVAGCR